MNNDQQKYNPREQDALALSFGENDKQYKGNNDKTPENVIFDHSLFLLAAKKTWPISLAMIDNRSSWESFNSIKTNRSIITHFCQIPVLTDHIGNN